LLLGIDLVKDPPCSEAAYDDAAGVTAEFTRNLFVRMNARSRHADSTCDAIEHVSWFDRTRERHRDPRAFHAHRPTIALPQHGRRFTSRRASSCMTEISTKFRVPVLARSGPATDSTSSAVFGGDGVGYALMLFRRRAARGGAAADVVAHRY
jgi:L-histidine N-alpha-methyltransferase